MCNVLGKTYMKGINPTDNGDFVFLSCQGDIKQYSDYTVNTIVFYAGSDQGNSLKEKKDQIYSHSNKSIISKINEFVTNASNEPPRIDLWEKLEVNKWTFVGEYTANGVQRTKDSTGRYIYHYILYPKDAVNINNDGTLTQTQIKNHKIQEAIQKKVLKKRARSKIINNAQKKLRRIPDSVKKFVYERDSGKCIICESKQELNFDHILPFAKGGTSTDPDNIQLLCQTCNLKKLDSFNEGYEVEAED